MHITEKRTAIILQILQDKQDLQYCGHYGEPGYNDPEKSILFANWNNVSKTTADYLESAGFSLEWSDEWIIDWENNKAYRTAPDSHGWIQQWRMTDDGELLTPDDSIEEWIDNLSMSDYAHQPHALPDYFTEAELIEAGFIRYNGNFESGWHAGQTDDPVKIARLIFDTVPDVEKVIFRIAENSQFYTVWQAYYLQSAADESQAAA